MIFLKRLISAILLFMAVLEFSGCGATIDGVGQDVSRIGRGIKTIFVRDR